jgi:hypothetical protein
VPGAGLTLDITPDGSWHTRIESSPYITYLQRRGSLYLSVARTLHDALEAQGTAVDRLGDDHANGGEYNRRHNAVVRAFVDAVTAGAVGSVIQGDKEDKAKTDHLNSTHVVDVAEVGGDVETGGDVNYEIKVPTCLKKSRSEGNGSTDGGGKPASVGHLHAFGSTEEHYRVLILGCKERGRKSDGPFVHKTGRGWVKAQQGHYYDALFRKRSRVVPIIIEATGGITDHARAHLRYLARRSSGTGAVDRTRYGSTRTSTKSFYTHHAQMLSKAAVVYDALAINKHIVTKRQKLINNTKPAADAAAPDGMA